MNYWAKNEKLHHLTPPGAMPEPIEFALFLRSRLEGMHVADIGCGAGRLAPLFESVHYRGFDINPAAIEQAKLMHPRRAFAVMPKLVQAEAALFHTVLLHMPGAKVDELLDKVIADHIVISEIMSPSLRNTTVEPYAYNRGKSWYIDKMEDRGYTLEENRSFCYGNDRYGPEHKLNVLLFDKRHP